MQSKLINFSDVVAEFAVTLTLNTIKRVSESIEDAKNGKWILGDLFWMCGSSKLEKNTELFVLFTKFYFYYFKKVYSSKLLEFLASGELVISKKGFYNNFF